MLLFLFPPRGGPTQRESRRVLAPLPRGFFSARLQATAPGAAKESNPAAGTRAFKACFFCDGDGLGASERIADRAVGGQIVEPVNESEVDSRQILR